MSREQHPPCFEYYVFESEQEAPTRDERGSGVYLHDSADSRYLRKFFDPLYASAGLSIVPSGNQLVAMEGLDAVEAAVTRAISEVQVEREEWPVVIGYEFVPHRQEPGAPIIRHASKQRLLEFLFAISEMIRRAKKVRGYLHFGGGV